MTLFAIAGVLTLMLLFATFAGAEPSPAPPLRMYSQELQITCASPEDAQKLAVRIAPVWDNRTWAFSARWDDCNPNSLVMQQHMDKFGLGGTFYLNQTDDRGRFGEQFARQLSQGRFSVGAHSMTHPKFAELKPNQVFWEVLANRVEREAQTDEPVNSLAFPFGQYESKDDPRVLESTSLSLRRAGLHHCVYVSFVRDNPHLEPGEFSTVLQVVPGDRQVDAAKFQEQLDKILVKWPDAYAKSSRCISLGVHPWQQGEEWGKLDAVFAGLAGRPDWWYCSLTQYAAYARQVRDTRVEGQPTTGATRTFSLRRPHPADLGDDVPLTVVLTGADVQAVTLDGAAAPCEKRDAGAVVSLPHGPAAKLPAQIVHIAMPEGASAPVAELGGARLSLSVDRAAGKLTLSCATAEGGPLREAWVRFRLPLEYAEGVLTRTVEALGTGDTEQIEVSLPAMREDPQLQEGPHYFVAEIDCLADETPVRAFVTALAP